MRDEWRFARKLKGESFSIFSFFVLSSSFFLKPHFLKPQGPLWNPCLSARIRGEEKCHKVMRDNYLSEFLLPGHPLFQSPKSVLF
jgi:hypothetical protein